MFENVKDYLNNVSHIKVSVKDSGVGIKDEDKPKLFKLFGLVKNT